MARRAARRSAASTTRVSAVDKPDSSADDWASAETRQHILTRTEGLRVVTDDNMELEWPPRLTALKVDR